MTTPDQVSGLQLWLSGDSGVFSDAGVTPANDSDRVEQWNDRSGNGNNATQLTLNSRPRFIANFFGFPSIQFNGAAQLSVGSNSQFVDSSFTVLAVFYRSADTNANNTFGFQAIVNKGDGQSATGSVWELMAHNSSLATPPFPSGSFDTFFGSTNNNTDCMFGGTGASLSSAIVQMTGIRNGNSIKQIWRNGILLSTGGDSGNSLNSGSTPLGIGACGADASHLNFIGQIYEIIYYNRVLTSTEQSAIEAYLNTKYVLPGVTSANVGTMTIATFSNTNPPNFFINNPADIFTSSDGTNFITPTGITNPVFTPFGAGGVGSSAGTAAYSVLFYGGNYWNVYEFNNNSGNNPKFGIASSLSLNGPWSWVADVTVLASATNAFVWNPRWFVDDDGTVYIIVGAQNNALEGSVMQPFIVTSLNPGTFTSWSAARSITGTGINASIIDYFMLSPKNSPNGKYNIWYKTNADSTTPNIEYMSSASRETGYTVTQSGNWLNIPNYANTNPEGMLLRKIGSTWRLYFSWDAAISGYGGPNWYYIDSYDNWASWTNFTITKNPTAFGMGTGWIFDQVVGPFGPMVGSIGQTVLTKHGPPGRHFTKQQKFGLLNQIYQEGLSAKEALKRFDGMTELERAELELSEAEAAHDRALSAYDVTDTKKVLSAAQEKVEELRVKWARQKALDDARAKIKKRVEDAIAKRRGH